MPIITYPVTYGGADFEGGVVINDNSASVDFQVKTASNPFMLFVNGLENYVSIGTSVRNATSEVFSVNGDMSCQDLYSNSVYADYLEISELVFLGSDLAASKIRTSYLTSDSDFIDLQINEVTKLSLTASTLESIVPIDAGTNEITCGSINRASDTLSLEIGGVNKLTISSSIVTSTVAFTAGTNSITGGSLTVGTEEVTCGSINRGTGTLEIKTGGVARISIGSAAIQTNGNILVGSTQVSEVTCGSINRASDTLSLGRAGAEDIKIGQNTIVINDNQNDKDFRVEGIGMVHLLCTDAGSNFVGIGTNVRNSSERLVVSGDVNIGTNTITCGKLQRTSAGTFEIEAPATMNLLIGGYWKLSLSSSTINVAANIDTSTYTITTSSAICGIVRSSGKTAFTSDIQGYWLGLDGGVGKLYLGTDVNYLKWDGTKLSTNGVLLTGIAIGSERAILGWQFTGSFSTTAYNTVSWTAGNILFTNGDLEAVALGSTGVMSAKTYIYQEQGESTFQVSTDPADSVGSGKILIAVATPTTLAKGTATFIVFGAGGDHNIDGLNIVLRSVTASHIVADSITANEIAANTITAGEIAAGTITGDRLFANTITGDKIDAGTITANNIKGTGFGSLNISSGTITLSSTGKMVISTGAALEISATDGILVTSGGDIKIESGGSLILKEGDLLEKGEITCAGGNISYGGTIGTEELTPGVFTPSSAWVGFWPISTWTKQSGLAIGAEPRSQGGPGTEIVIDVRPFDYFYVYSNNKIRLSCVNEDFPADLVYPTMEIYLDETTKENFVRMVSDAGLDVTHGVAEVKVETDRSSKANIIFSTGLASATERMKIDASGNIILSNIPAGSSDYDKFLVSDSGTIKYRTGDQTRQDIGVLQTIVVEIGDWNMDSTASVNVAHGIADFKKIRSVTGIIRNDGDTTSYPIAEDCSVSSIGSTNVVLARTESGDFDSSDFDSTSYNRGWITLLVAD